MRLFLFGFSRTSDEVQSAVPADSQEGTEQKESRAREKYEQKRKTTGRGLQRKGGTHALQSVQGLS